MKILMVGAGAVGQVFAYHLARGGAQLSFYVKPKYAAEVGAGLTLYPLNRFDKKTPIAWRDYSVVSSDAEVAAQKFDQVWLSVSSTALRGGWLESFAKATGDAVVVSLQPGSDDRDYILQYVPESRRVNGGIFLISYQAPLPQETRFAKPGIAYWFPPLTASPFAGPRQFVQAVVALLKKGGQPAREAQNFRNSVAFSTAASSPILAALELSDWKFASLRRGPWLKTGLAAGKEAAAALAAHLGVGVPLSARLLSGSTLSLALLAAPLLIPIDVETYIQYHFTKVGDQTRMYLENFVVWAKNAGLATPALQQLIAALPPAR